MTRDELIQMRNEVIDELIADGMDEDDARFAAMTAAARPDGILSEQATGPQHPALIELAKAGRAFLNGYEYVAPVKAPRAYEMEDGSMEWVS
jgi:hypothetical protein